MKKLILTFADLWLKKTNKNEFILSLKENVNKALDGINFKINKLYDCIEIFDYENSDEEKILEILKKIPGISNILITYISVNNIEDIIYLIQNKKFISEKTKSFKLIVSRINKNFIYNSAQIITLVAASILQHYKSIKVDVHNPEVTIYIKIKNNCSWIYSNKIEGIKGLPIGLNGSCLSLLSGGIDSPVASFLLQSKGLKVDYMTFITNEVSEKTLEKLKNLIRTITLNKRIYSPKFYLVDFTSVQQEIAHSKDINYRIAIMRRAFYRIAEKVAIEYNYDSIASGDSLGQVASQTIESLNLINDLKTSKIIFRPLLTFSKQKIIDIAKEINTYEISIQEHEDVCSLFAPKDPITRPNILKAKKIESDLDLLNSLENMVFKQIRIIEV